VSETHADFEDKLAKLRHATHYDALWECFISNLMGFGADLIAYHHIAPPHAPDAGRIDILKYGYPKAWENFCKTEKLTGFDPLFNMAYTRTESFKWSEVLQSPHLGEKEQKFTTELNEWVKGDGYMIPLFGPSGRNGYISVGNMASIDDWCFEKIRSMKWLCQQFHLRYVTLRLGELPSDITLSEKDHEILKGLALGRSPESIAHAHDLSPDIVNSTLDTLVLTMGVSDLSSLMVRAQSLGLINTNENS